MTEKYSRLTDKYKEFYIRFENLVGSVEKCIDSISNIDSDKIIDEDYIEKILIPSFGLNSQSLEEQPKELSEYFGRGLHLWQYPNQFSRYLVWLAHNAKNVRHYMEIGCHWGGTFIVVTEWLKRIGAPLEIAIAVDPLEPTPFIRRYQEISDTPIVYLETKSGSPEFISYNASIKPDMVFIDGDHSMKGVMTDHVAVHKRANIIVYHDIASTVCVDTTLFWQYLKSTENDCFDFYEFIQQYETVNGSHQGIGVAVRRDALRK